MGPEWNLYFDGVSITAMDDASGAIHQLWWFDSPKYHHWHTRLQL